jgi:hypothetical protein
MKNIFQLSIITITLLLNGCHEYKETRISATIDSTNIIMKDSMQMQVANRNESFQRVYNDIVGAIKKEDYDKVDQYIDSVRGYYLITRPHGQSFYSYQHGNHFGDLSGGEGPEAEAAEGFFSNLKEANMEMLKLLEPAKEDSSICGFTKEGAYKINMRKVKPLYSNDYRTNKQGGKKADNEFLQALTEMEGSFTTKVYLNKLNKNMKSGQILYFSESEGKIYLSALDLSNCP